MLTPGQWHLRASLLKSALRIFAFFALASGSLTLTAGLMIAAELLGIAEEMV